MKNMKNMKNIMNFCFRNNIILQGLWPCNYYPCIFLSIRLYSTDYSVLQALGLDPSYVHIHKSVLHNNVNKIVSWSYGDMNYHTFGDINSVSVNDIAGFLASNINKDGVVYSILPTLDNKDADPSEMFISVGGQIVLTKLANPQEVLNILESNKKALCPRYGVSGCLSGVLIFKWRTISYNINMFNLLKDKISVKTITDSIIKKDRDTDMDLIYNDIIPLSFDLGGYGKIIDKEFIVNNYKVKGIHYQYTDDITIFAHDMIRKNSRVLTIFKNGCKYAECLDKISSDGLLIREYENGVKLYIDVSRNIIQRFDKQIECRAIPKGHIDLVKDFKISAFDIESYTDVDNMLCKAFACGFIAPDQNPITYYLLDFKDSRDMLERCLIDMLKSNLGTVYVHNLSKFDTYYLNPILKDGDTVYGDYKYNKTGKILKIKVRFKGKSKSKAMFTFRDSILMVPGSLKDISSGYNTSNKKLYFPYSYVTGDNLDYIGVKPDIKYYDGISKEVYSSIPVSWNLREELIKYLNNDLLSLQEVMVKFAEDIYKLEQLNITKIPTTSSVAFRSIVANYLEPGLLYSIKGPAHNDMRRGYYGGVTDVYNLKGKGVIYVYDINSSYPASMKMDMPVGKPVFSNDRALDNYFGIVYAKVKTPRDGNGNYIMLKYPPLPYRLSSGDIINGVGSWSGMYCSEILKYVRNVHNYDIDVLYGYKYDRRGNLFNGFIDKYYDIKSGKNTDLNINRNTSKLILNSSYGRTGLKIEAVFIELTNAKRSKLLQTKYHVRKIIEQSPNTHWVSYDRVINPFYLKEEDDSLLDNTAIRLKENDSSYDVEQCLPIALFTTAYSTIRLFEAIRLVEDSGGIIYSVDTDSIHANVPLPDYLIGSELGMWKLEFIGKEGYYPLPKLYLIEGHEVVKGGKSDICEIQQLKRGKGVKKGSISKDDYLKLLGGQSITKFDTRFITNKKESSVRIMDVPITIKPDLLKRKVIRKDGKIWTVPFILNDGVIVD